MHGIVAACVLLLAADGAPRSDLFNVSGAAMVGVSILNESYGARPDNTELALYRYAAHLDVDILGPALSVPMDMTTFTSGSRPGLWKLIPTELDVQVGLQSTWEIPLSLGFAEFSGRFEHDRPLDQGQFTQTFACLPWAAGWPTGT